MSYIKSLDLQIDYQLDKESLTVTEKKKKGEENEENTKDETTDLVYNYNGKKKAETNLERENNFKRLIVRWAIYKNGEAIAKGVIPFHKLTPLKLPIGPYQNEENRVNNLQLSSDSGITLAIQGRDYIRPLNNVNDLTLNDLRQYIPRDEGQSETEPSKQSTKVNKEPKFLPSFENKFDSRRLPVLRTNKPAHTMRVSAELSKVFVGPLLRASKRGRVKVGPTRRRVKTFLEHLVDRILLESQHRIDRVQEEGLDLTKESDNYSLIEKIVHGSVCLNCNTTKNYFYENMANRQVILDFFVVSNKADDSTTVKVETVLTLILYDYSDKLKDSPNFEHLLLNDLFGFFEPFFFGKKNCAFFSPLFSSFWESLNWGSPILRLVTPVAIAMHVEREKNPRKDMVNGISSSDQGSKGNPAGLQPEPEHGAKPTVSSSELSKALQSEICGQQSVQKVNVPQPFLRVVVSPETLCYELELKKERRPIARDKPNEFIEYKEKSYL